MVFMDERKFLPTKQYHNVLGCGLVTKIFPRTGQKFTSHENFTPLKNTRYTVCCGYNFQRGTLLML